jgi:DNA protecting protein DprA
MSQAERNQAAAELAMLLAAPTIGPRRAMDLLARHGSARQAIAALRGSPSGEPLRRFLDQADLADYLHEIEHTLAVGAGYLLWTDADYPANLRSWPGRPPILYVKGDLAGLGPQSLALVGRVDPSDDGRAAAARFAGACVAHDVTVISGLAKGIDAAAHRGALDAGGWTYAVVGHGLDFAYPPDNADLYAQIPTRGAVLSQFATGVGPQRWTFPMRNEVMCTLAMGTVIVEATDGCGSLIQADFSFKHSRPVFLLSRNLDGNPGWATALVRRGAHVIRRFEEVLAVLDQAAPAADGGQQTLELDTTLGDPADAPAPPAALFDLDGVVIDTRGATAAALAALASQALGREVTAEQAAKVVLRSPPKALAALGVADAYQVYRRGYDAQLVAALPKVVTVGPVVDAIRRLRAAGIPVGMVTSQARRRLARLLSPDLLALFDVVVAWDDVKARKPAPDGILAAVARLGADRHRSVYVGDTADDLLAARKAEVVAVAVSWGFGDPEELRRWSPDTIVARPEQLAGELERRLDVPA